MDSRKNLDKGYIQLYPVRSPRSSRKVVVCTSQFHTPKRESAQTSRTKFSLRGRDCNIPRFGVTKIEETDVCIAFMHRKSGEFSRFQVKHVTVTEVSLDLDEIEVDHQAKCYKPQCDLC